MSTIDFAAADRRALINSTGVRRVYDNPTIESRRQKAIEYLGENWVLHPNYKPNPKHSLTGFRTNLTPRSF